MLSNDRKQILLMHPVRVNWKLAKYNKDTAQVDGEEIGLSSESMNSVNTWLNDSFISIGDSSIASNNQNVWDGIPFGFNSVFKNKIHKSIGVSYIKTKLFLHNLLNGNKLLKPEEFFDELKNSFKQIEEIDPEDLSRFESEIKHLDETYQKHLTGKLKGEYKMKQYHNVLVKSGFDKYQEESDIINFITKTKVGLCLEEITYFKYEIPEDVVTKMKKADRLKVFDNFYILYKDPNVTQPKILFETKKEEKKRKIKEDPILFGVICNSTKLYYIGDWVSDFCDLTYDTLIKSGNPDRNLKDEK